MIFVAIILRKTKIRMLDEEGEVVVRWKTQSKVRIGFEPIKLRLLRMYAVSTVYLMKTIIDVDRNCWLSKVSDHLSTLVDRIGPLARL